MKLATNVKPVGYLQENADEIVRTLSERGEPLIITRDGEAQAVVQEIAEYERTQQTLALLIFSLWAGVRSKKERSARRESKSKTLSADSPHFRFEASLRLSWPKSTG